MPNTIRTCLWFRDGRGREAAELYCSLHAGSRVQRALSTDVGHGTFSVIDFVPCGVPYQILDAGPQFTRTEAVSISVETEDQSEAWLAGVGPWRPAPAGDSAIAPHGAGCAGAHNGRRYALVGA
jgi:hypothetical protein